MDRLPSVLMLPEDITRQAANLCLCLPVACRRHTALGLSEPRRPHLSGLAHASPSLSPPSAWTTVLLDCFFWPRFLHFCPRDISRPLHRKSQISILSIPFGSGSPNRMNLLSHAQLAALPLAAALTASRLPSAVRQQSHGLRGLV
jgi:hypothetical protein